MRYEHIVKGRFISRPNRFIAHVDVGGREVTAHVKNTGRCRELLLPGASVILQHHKDTAATGRKTSYSLIGVYKELHGTQVLINMDSQAPNVAAFEWLKQAGSPWESVSDLRREVVYGQSRFDLAFTIGGRSAFMEVKGVTLETDGVAMFPDAPTERGLKHTRELMDAGAHGCEAYLLFVIQMQGVHEFRPNAAAHPAFGAALKEAARAGVHILSYDCLVTEDGLTIRAPVKTDPESW